MLKKIMLLCFMFINFSLYAKSYKITSFEGNVTFKSVDGWESVYIGQEIQSYNILNTSLNSNLTISDEDGNKFVIKSMQKGSVENLINVALKKNINSKKIKTSSIADVDYNSKGVATASSRASEAKSDLDWEE